MLLEQSPTDMHKPRSAVVTGGATGIGFAISRMLHERGFQVLLTARTVERARDAAQTIGSNAIGFSLDVTSSESIGKFTEAIRGYVPCVLINNAGIASSAPIAKVSDEEWDHIMETNLNGVFRLTKALLPRLREQAWGRIVNMVSVAARIGSPYIIAYTASKHALLGFTRSLAMELARTGITVNAVAPGYVDTEMTARTLENIMQKTGRTRDEAMKEILKQVPLGRLVTADEVAEVVCFFLRVNTDAITGQCINVDGGSQQA